MKKNETIIGVDVGGTKIYAARFSQNLQKEEEIQMLTEGERGEKYVLQTLIQAIQKIKKDSVVALGIGWPGPIFPSGRIMRTPNIPGFFYYHLAQKLQKFFHLPVYIENDSRLFTFAEAKKRKKENLVGVILGTGVGGGVVQKGKMKRGFTGFVGEFGHIKNKEGEKYDTVLSGPGFQKGVLQYGQKEAMKIWKRNLISLLQEISKRHSSKEIVFGGGVSTHVLKEILPEIQKETDIQLSITDIKNAGALGAAIYAKERLER